MSKHESEESITGMSSDKFDPFELVGVLFGNWKLIAVASFGFAFALGVYAKFFVKPYYESSAVILPAQDSQGASSAAQALASSGGFSSLLRGVGVSTYEKRITAILESRDLVARVVEREGLFKKFYPDLEFKSAAEKEFAVYNFVRLINRLVLIEEASPILRLSFRHEDPQLAHDVLSGFLNHLDQHLKENVVTQARATEMFIAERILEAEKALREIEDLYTKTKMDQGVVSLSDQSQLTFSTAADLQARLIDKELEIDLYQDILRDSGEVARLKSEKEQIENRLSKIVGRTSKGRKEKLLTPLQELPELEVRYASLEARFNNQLEIVSLLRRQLEVARIETKKSQPSFEVIEDAFVPMHIAGPNKKLFVIVGFFVGLLLASLFVILINLIPQKQRFPLVRSILVETSAEKLKKSKRA